MHGASVRTGTFDPDAGTDWQNNWLDADAMRLGFTIERLARCSAAPLKLADLQLADLTFSGRFRLGRPVELLQFIGGLFGLRAERKGAAVYLGRTNGGTSTITQSGTGRPRKWPA